MPGFNVPPGGLVRYSPELLAQIAQNAFRPPQLPGMPGLPSMGGQPDPGFNVGEGAGGLMQGLAAFRPSAAVAEQRAHPTFGVLDPTKAQSTSSIDRALDPSLGSLLGNTTMPNTMMGGGSDLLSLFSNLGLSGSSLGGLFGGGMGGSAGFFGGG